MANQLESASNILLLAPALNPGEPEVCSDILTAADATKQNTLVVTYTQSASEWAKKYEQHVGDLPEQLAIISVGEMTRSTAQPQSPQSDAFPGPMIEAVESPGDLTGLAIHISEYLQDWGTDKWNGGAPQMALCFDSLTVLLQYADLQRSFRFLHTLTGHISQYGAVGHYHIDPDAHDEQTLSTLYSLFDCVVEVTDEPGEWTVKTWNP